jgi:hypothetical protein
MKNASTIYPQHTGPSHYQAPSMSALSTSAEQQLGDATLAADAPTRDTARQSQRARDRNLASAAQCGALALRTEGREGVR